MTRFRGLVTATASVALLLPAACARPDDVVAGEPAPSAGPGAAAELVLRISLEGGFVPPERIPGRLPVLSAYADGRIFTEGPVPAIYPGPALPNLQVRQVDPAEVRALAERAVSAGVREGADFGVPGVADIPATRIDVLTAEGPVSVKVEALREAQADDPALTADQRAARAKLSAYVDQVIDPGAATEAYRPEVMAAIAQPFVVPEAGRAVGPGPQEWPGPALPGEKLSPHLELGCVEVTGAQLGTLLTVAKDANQNTPWRSGGKDWTVAFRPLLPDETGCADLRAAQ